MFRKKKKKGRVEIQGNKFLFNRVVNDTTILAIKVGKGGEGKKE